jgi:uncharacterized membrane protein
VGLALLGEEKKRPNAEGAKVSQKTQKIQKRNFKNHSLTSFFSDVFGFLLRTLRNLRVLCVQTRFSALSL